MNSTNLKKYPPNNLAELVAKHRKVEPVKIVSDNKSIPARESLLTTLDPISGSLSSIELNHLLRRTLFGIRKSDVAGFEGKNIDTILSGLIINDPIPSPPVNDYNNIEQEIEDPNILFGETWIESPYVNDLEGLRVQSLKSWIVRNWVHQPSTIHEKMILFWHNLLPTQTWDVFIPKASYKYFAMLRRNALGNFKTLIKELTLDPSMLIFLNGTFNNKAAPDENYARELQELFCIGKGPNAKFTEGDVQAAAKVLTGWLVDTDSLELEGEPGSFFFPDYHDTSTKTFSSFYKNTIIEGKSGASGAEELDELLNMIFDNEETALYLSRRLYNFFVYNTIDAATEQNVIVPMAQLLRESNYEIEPVLKALFKSTHFFDEANIGALIKSPVDHLIGMWCTLEVQAAIEKEVVPKENIHLNYRMGISMIWYMATIGMEIGDPPSVSGWPAYYQSPQFDKYWISTDTITNRALTSDGLIFWGFWIADEVQFPVDLIAFLKNLDHPEDPNLMLSESISLLLGIEVSVEKRNELKSILLTGQATDAYWTTAWEQLLADPLNAEYKTVVENRLKATFQSMLQLGEFQLM